MPELTADQAIEKLRGLGWKIWESPRFPGRLGVKRPTSWFADWLFPEELIALAQSQGGEG